MMACPNKHSDSDETCPSTSLVAVCDPLVTFPGLPNLDLDHFIHDPSQREWTEPFTFVVIADPQFGLLEKYYLKKENPRWDEEVRITTAAILQVNKLRPKPKFVLICGDMLDTRPGTDDEIAVRNEQYQDFLKTLQLLDEEVKVVFCAGNHDVCDIPTPQSIDVYHQQFGPDVFSFWVNGVKFVVLNSSYWKSPSTIPIHYEHQKKLLSRIGDPAAKHLVVFQHIPFFVTDPDEEDIGFLNIEKEQRFPVLEKLEAAGVRHVFCGHCHRNISGSYKNIEQTVTSALCNPLGSDPCGFRMVNVEENGITSEFVRLELESLAIAEACPL